MLQKWAFVRNAHVSPAKGLISELRVQGDCLPTFGTNRGPRQHRINTKYKYNMNTGIQYEASTTTTNHQWLPGLWGGLSRLLARVRYWAERLRAAARAYAIARAAKLLWHRRARSHRAAARTLLRVVGSSLALRHHGASLASRRPNCLSPLTTGDARRWWHCPRHHGAWASALRPTGGGSPRARRQPRTKSSAATERGRAAGFGCVRRRRHPPRRCRTVPQASPAVGMRCVRHHLQLVRTRLVSGLRCRALPDGPASARSDVADLPRV